MKSKRKRELLFWVIFLLLNFLLFLPAYIGSLEQSSFFPWQFFSTWSPVVIGKGLLYNRPNLDIFRWSIEFSLLLFSFFLWRKKKRGVFAFSFLLWLFYWLLFLYQIYHQAFYNLYQTPPFFYNDWGLIKVGWSIVFHDFHLWYLLVLGGVGLLLALTYRAIRFLLQTIKSHPFSRLSIGLMGFMFLESLVIFFRWGYRAWPEHIPQFHIAPMVKNIQESLEAQRQMKQLDISALTNHRPYEKVALEGRPNFFFLFVESYGRIVYDHPEVYKKYKEALKKMESRLRDNAWHSRSVLSTAPVSGGASWVSYSTFLDGFDFQNRGTYWALLQDSVFARYQHLPRLLQSKGYRNYRLSAIGGSEDMEIPWEVYTRFYAVDEWIRYRDFDYRGLLYGWGPSPPDQFSLHFANAHIRKKQGANPFSLFFITQNSHNPFVSPLTAAEDWRSLNDSTVNQQQDSRIFEKPLLKNYTNAIIYQMDFITHFIATEGQPNDIFIICGDHQPPLFPKPDAGFETPLHIIGKDSAFIHSFREQDFSAGLYLADTTAKIRHEGFYSLLLHHLGNPAPDYLPEGVLLSQ